MVAKRGASEQDSNDEDGGSTLEVLAVLAVVAERALPVLVMVAPVMKGDYLMKGDDEQHGSSNERRW